jgi:ankyrin repeat protein/uncharacterized GH25 family protein
VKANASLRAICHFPILHLVMVVMLTWPPLAFCDELGNSTTQFTGTVVDEQGRPVVGATVDCYHYESLPQGPSGLEQEPKFEQRTNTNAQGSFAIPALPGATLVVAQKAGLAPAWRTWFPYLPRLSAPLVLTAPTTLSGVVIDTNGYPVANAEVWVADVIIGDNNALVTHLNNASGKPTWDYFFTRTSGDGRFRIENFPKDACATLAVHKSGMAQQLVGNMTGWMDFVAGQEDIELILGPAGTLEGKVTDQATGKPIANAAVWMSAKPFNGEWREPALTRADGTFHVSDLRPELYRIDVTFPGQPLSEWVWELTNVTANIVAGQTTTNVVVRVSKGTMMEVTIVVTNSLQPVAQALVSAGQVTTSTDSNGVARLRVPAGQGWVSAAISGWSPQWRRVEIEAGKTNQMRIEMVPPSHISGIVRDPSGSPDAGVQVSIYPGQHDNPPIYGETKTDENGRYDLIIHKDPRLRQGGFTEFIPRNFILARDLRRNLAVTQVIGSSHSLTVTNFGEPEVIPANLDLNLQSGISFSGSVVDTKGTPITNAMVDFRIATGNSMPRLEEKPLKTDANGSFSVNALPQGQAYEISSVTAKGYGSAYKRLDAKTTWTDHVELAPLVLKRTDRTLAGQVLGPDGQPVPGASVIFAGLGQLERPATKTGRGGHFIFNAVCEGEVQLNAYAYIVGSPDQNTSLTSGNAPGIKAQGGDTNIVINLQKQNVNSSAASAANFTTPLHEAAKNGDINQVKSLLANKADVNAKGIMGRTPLHEAARGGYTDVVELLLTNKADARAKDRMGNTALHEAAIGGNAEIATLLLAHGADVNALNDKGETSLGAALFNHATDMSNLLRKHGAVEHGYQVSSPTLAMTNRDAAELRDAIHSDDLKEVRTLLKANPSLISSRDVQDRTPLILAAMAGHTNLVEVLLANKADLQATDMFGRSALHWAALLAQGDMVQVLLADGADLNARSKGGDTPLHEAAHGGNTNMVEIIKILLANGADINATNNAGGTPLSEVVAVENRSVPPNLPATAAAGLETMKEREKGVAEFLRQHGGHE